MGKLKIDKKYHYYGGFLIASCFWALFNYIGYAFLFKGSIKELLSASITISAIAIGFLATSKSILISIRSDKILKWLKDGGHYSTLIDYIMNSVHWCFYLTIISAIGLMIDFDNPNYLDFIFICFWLFVVSTSIISSHRVIDLFSTILKSNLGEEKTKTR